MMTKNVLPILALMLLAPLTASAADKAGEVVHLKGTAVIERGEAKIPAALKAPLFKGDALATAGRSAAKVLFSDDTILTLMANSRLTVDEYLYNTEQNRSQSLFKLFLGKLRAVVGRSAFKISTETAIAGVKGTVFILSYDSATRTSKIAVIEGEVEFGNINPAIGGTITLKAGQSSSVTGDEPPTQPAPFQLEDEDMEAEIASLGLPIFDITQPPLGGPVSDERKLNLPMMPPIDQVRLKGSTPINFNIVF